MQRKNWSIAFRWGGRRFIFAPNQNFWFAVLGLALACLWLCWGQAQEGQVLRQSLAADGILPQGQDEQLALFSPKIALAGSAFISLIIRLLVNYLVKINKIVLLSHGSLPSMPQTWTISVWKRTFHVPSGKSMGYGMLLTTSLAGGGYFYFKNSNEELKEQLVAMESQYRQKDKWIESQVYKQDVMGELMDYFQQHDVSEEAMAKNYRDAFLLQQQLIITQFLIKEKVSRIDMLSNEALLEMHSRVRDLFISLILDKLKVEKHVYDFFTDTTDLDKLETALMEQAKFHVPASVKLAQAALETGYGKRVIRNNYFGIKDKSEKAPAIETVEYFTEEEAKLYASKIVSKQKVNKGGKELWRCKVRDSFAQYGTPWESFRAHSLFLKENSRYHALFTEGKDYKAWADRIGSTKYGGVGYATSPIYGQLIKQIVQRYHLHLLDR